MKAGKTATFIVATGRDNSSYLINVRFPNSLITVSTVRAGNNSACDADE
jgi:hypothetical protein